MLAESGAGWHMGGMAAATLPTALRPSSALRRRIHGLWPTTAAHDDNSGLLASTARVSMSADVCDFLDLTDVGAAGAGCTAGGAAGTDDNVQTSMLNLLLSRLPEPPASQPQGTGPPGTASALADELPAPPVSPPTSPRQRASVADIAVTADAAPPVAAQHEPMEAVASESPLRSSTFLPALETPAVSRRNTESVRQSPQSAGRLHGRARGERAASPALSLLDGEMPPASPLFAHISAADIQCARQSIRDARRARSLSGRPEKSKRATWSIAEGEPLFDRTPASSPQHNNGPDCPAPLRTLTPQPAVSGVDQAGSGSSDRPPRCFQVHVHELFLGPPSWCASATGYAPRVAFTELDTSSIGSEDESQPPSPTDTVVGSDDVDAAVRAVLQPFPSVLALSERAQRMSACSSRRNSAQPSRLRMPSRLGRGGSPLRTRSTPALSFLVPDSPGPVAADRFVQSVDIEKMVQAHLPHLYARIGPCEGASGDTAAAAEASGPLRGRTPSASSAMTLAESTAAAGSLCEYAESHQSASSEETLHRPSRRGSGIAPQLQVALRKPGRSVATAAASLKIQRVSAADQQLQLPPPLQIRRRVHTDSQIPPVAEHRRRCEVQALLSQANAVLSSGRHRTPTALPAPTSLPVGRLRPPRASLPIVGPGGIHRLGSLSVNTSRRTSMLSSPSPRASAAWDVGAASSGIPSPGSASPSGLRTPTALSVTLTRLQHRIERVGSGSSSPDDPISPLALTPVRAPSLAAPRSVRLSAALAPVRALPVAGIVSRIPGVTPGPRSAAATVGPALRRSQQQNLPPLLGRIPRPSMPAASAEDSDSDVSSMVFSPQLAPATLLRRPSWKRGSIPWASAGPQSAPPARQPQEEAFLTLRPVHTPDIVPRTMDPRLVERAMTPMLKTTVQPVASLHSRMASRDSVSIGSHSQDTLRTSEAADAPTAATVAAKRLSVVPEAQADQVSRLSPISSPQASPRPSSESKRRLRAPFISRKWSSKPAAAAAAPPTPVTPSEPKKLASRIPTLQKARSLWSLRALHAK